jgi:hypothetical protein
MYWNRDIESAVAATPGIPDISIHHEPESKGAFKALRQKGLKIKGLQRRRRVG